LSQFQCSIVLQMSSNLLWCGSSTWTMLAKGCGQLYSCTLIGKIVENLQYCYSDQYNWITTGKHYNLPCARDFALSSFTAHGKGVICHVLDKMTHDKTQAHGKEHFQCVFGSHCEYFSLTLASYRALEVCTESKEIIEVEWDWYF